jgi:hypothetical protein
MFSSYKFWYLPTHFDLFFAGVTPGGDGIARLPDDGAITRLRRLMPWPYKTVMAPFRGLSKVLSEPRYQTVALPLWNAVMPIIMRLEVRRTAT